MLECSENVPGTEKSFPIMSPSSDEEHTTEHTPNHHVPQPPQAVFPACICAAVLPIVHLMEDGEVREDGVAGTHSSVLAWRISGTGEPGGLPSMGSHRVGHD